MSKIAIIVSGSLRNLINASSSWTIPGDYFLVVDENIYQTKNLDPVGNSLDIIRSNLENSHVKFNTVTICLNNQLPENMRHHPSVNMVNKWKLAYYNILPFHTINNYQKVILLRPDLYLHTKAPIKNLVDVELQDHFIYTTAYIFSEPRRNVEIMNDVLLMFNMKTFGDFVNGFFAYYLEHFAETLIENGYEIHSMLAKFIRQRDISVNDILNNYFEFVILRNNSQDMFENGVLKTQYSFADLQLKAQEWWQETYG